MLSSLMSSFEKLNFGKLNLAAAKFVELNSLASIEMI
jgi:hypothetical protein